MNTGSSSGSGMMIPYLHFTGGDFLIFSSWAPTSPGAIAGACFVLILIALVERLLAAMRSLLDLHWHKRSNNSLCSFFFVISNCRFAFLLTPCPLPIEPSQ